MDANDRRLLQSAITNHEQVAVYYNHPERGPVTRHVRPYELSVNRSGRPVLWGTDSIHGPRQIHAFRLDRILTVTAAKRPPDFRPASSITRHLVSYGKVMPTLRR